MGLMPLAEVRSRTYKERDSWWTVLLVDPVAGRLTRRVAAHRSITPNLITVAAFLVGLAAAACFAIGGFQENRWWLVGGALAYHLSFTLDCVDGKVARLNGTGTFFGAWLDYIFDRLRILACTIALMGGQYAATDDVVYVLLGGVVIFLDMFRYLNQLEIFQVNTELRNKLDEARAAAGLAVAADPDNPDEAAARPGNRSMLALADGSTPTMGVFHRVRALLRRSRIRPHLIGGIEFQMAVFIVAPIAGAIVPVTIVTGALMIVFELAVIYMLYRATTTVSRQIRALSQPVVAQRVPAEDVDLSGAAPR